MQPAELRGRQEPGSRSHCRQRDALRHHAGWRLSPDPDTGTETVLHSFCPNFQCSDGNDPGASLVEVKGSLYGTTAGGGGNGYGTVFALDPDTGAEKMLYAFCPSGIPCPDGAGPLAGLIDVKGALYGATFGGGANGYGTVYALNRKTGRQTVVHSFGARRGDGAFPYASLIDVNGTLYGTTSGGSGTVFALDPGQARRP